MHQFYFIGAFFQEIFKKRVFVNLNSRYTDYFPEYSNFFGKALRLLKSMYSMTNYGTLSAHELIEWLLKAGLIQSQCRMYIYYKYAPDVTKNVVLYYVDDYVY